MIVSFSVKSIQILFGLIAVFESSFYRQNVDRQNVDRQNVDRQNLNGQNTNTQKTNERNINISISQNINTNQTDPQHQTESSTVQNSFHSVYSVHSNKSWLFYL